MLHGRFFLLMKFLYLNDKEFEKEKLKKLWDFITVTEGFKVAYISDSLPP
jgi:hypothetical protein